jgi:hypothetical protein
MDYVLPLIGLFFLVAPPGAAGAGYAFYRMAAGLNSPLRQIMRVAIVIIFGTAFGLTAGFPAAVVLSPWLVEIPLVRKIVNYDSQKSLFENWQRLGDPPPVPYEKPR